jgi:hypothetical protein
MSAAVCGKEQIATERVGKELRRPTPAPINFFYQHFHNSIRQELDELSSSVLALEPAAEGDLLDRLLSLKERYHFLEQVYKYHSSVEDEVRNKYTRKFSYYLPSRGACACGNKGTLACLQEWADAQLSTTGVDRWGRSGRVLPRKPLPPSICTTVEV